jgi:hypothetical protein
MKKVGFRRRSLGALFDETKIVHLVTIDGMEINVPPKGERPGRDSGNEEKVDYGKGEGGSTPGILFEKVIVTNAALTILPKDPKKVPLHFDIHRLRLESTGRSIRDEIRRGADEREAAGEIQSQGTFRTMGRRRTRRPSIGWKPIASTTRI